MPSYTVGPPIGGEDWLIQRVGPLVIGVWNTAMTQERIHACRRLYLDARREHGTLSVFARYRTNPFPLEVLSAQGARQQVVSLMREFEPSLVSVVCVVEGSGFRMSMMRLAAATVVQALPQKFPIRFSADLAAGLAQARRLGALDVVEEDVLRSHLEELDRRVVSVGESPLV